MPHEISNFDNILDSRDVIARIEELREAQATREGDAQIAWENIPEGAELRALEALQGNAKDYSPDWEYGATLIRETYWMQYVQELLEDRGDLPENIPHYLAIDWETTARNIAVDYTEVDFDGVTYLVQ